MVNRVSGWSAYSSACDPNLHRRIGPLFDWSEHRIIRRPENRLPSDLGGKKLAGAGQVNRGLERPNDQAPQHESQEHGA